VMPTMVRYEQTIDGKKTSKTKRDLFATLTFSDPAGAKSVTVSVPLGAFAPTAGSGNRVFDAVGAPGLTWRGGTVYPTGAGASVWFPSVFLAPTSGGPPIETRAAANGGQANSGADADNLSIVTPVANAGPPPTTTGARTGATPSATDQTRARAQAPIVAPSMRRGAQIAPVSIVVSLRETRPGNPFAAALAGVFGGSKDKLVALGDPETIEAAKTASATAKNTAIQAYATALGDFYNKKGAYCLAVGAPTPDPLTLQQKAAELLSSEVKLLATVSAVGERPPFTQLVNPETGDGAGCPAA
jgi:predicted outer membrane protein